MGKNFGVVQLGDEERLEEVAKEAGVYLDFDEVWREAKQSMAESGTNDAEVRIRGLDYVEVYK